MIRKPDARDFRESTTVAAIRDAGTLAKEGARGVGEGVQGFMRTGCLLLFGFGALMSVVAGLGPVGMLVVAGIGIAWAGKGVQTRSRRAAQDRAARWGAPTSLPVEPSAAPPTAPVQLDLSVGALGRKATKIGVPAILCFPTAGMFGFMLPFTLGAIVALALAFLLLARLPGDRTILRYDAETLFVKGLLGEATMLWADVGDIVVRTAAWWDVRVLFTSGARRNMVVLGRVNRLGGPDTLYIPIDLLGLDEGSLPRLLTQLLSLRAGAPVPEAAAIGERRPVPLVRPTLNDQPFDPDAIMARYLAEREALIASQRPDLVAPRRATFGRKLA